MVVNCNPSILQYVHSAYIIVDAPTIKDIKLFAKRLLARTIVPGYPKPPTPSDADGLSSFLAKAKKELLMRAQVDGSRATKKKKEINLEEYPWCDTGAQPTESMYVPRLSLKLVGGKARYEVLCHSVLLWGFLIQ